MVRDKLYSRLPRWHWDSGIWLQSAGTGGRFDARRLSSDRVFHACASGEVRGE